MPRESPTATHSGYVFCSWCTTKIPADACFKHRSSYFCPECTHKLFPAPVLRCSHCRDQVRIENLIFDFQTGRVFCQKCRPPMEDEGSSEKEFFRDMGTTPSIPSDPKGK